MRLWPGPRIKYSPTEKLLLVAVLALAIGLIVAQFSTSAARTRNSERKADIKALQLKVTEFYDISGYYPLALDGIKDLPPGACQAPGGHGTCAQPDYFYKAFKSAATASPTNPTDCDNKTTPCLAFVIYTYSMEKLPNPYFVPEK